MIPEVDIMKCTGCGICVRACPVSIIGMIGKKASIMRDLCEECGICAFSCPDVAILFELEDAGQTITPYIAAFPTARRLATTPGY